MDSAGPIRFVTPASVGEALPWPALIGAIEAALGDTGAASPSRAAHFVPVPGAAEATLLLKPAWTVGDVIVVKVVTVFPDNGAADLPMVNAVVVMFSATNGTLLGVCDGNELTRRRTAAASAVAAKRLARPDASRLLVLGTGALAPMMAEAHSAVRPLDHIEVWGRNTSSAAQVVSQLADAGLPASVCTDLDAGVTGAHIVSAVTAAGEPLIRGALVAEGTHVDLVGSFSATTRESDDDVMRRASSIYVDSPDDAPKSGDLAQPLAAGVITTAHITGDLAGLVDGTVPGRVGEADITVFKSVGIAIEDLAAARLVFSPSNER